MWDPKFRCFRFFDSPYTIILPPYTLSHIYRSGILVEYIDRQKRLHWRLFQAHFILFRIVSSFKFTFYLALSTINKVSLFPIFLGRVSIFFVETFINLEKYFLFWITYPTIISSWVRYPKEIVYLCTPCARVRTW